MQLTSHLLNDHSSDQTITEQNQERIWNRGINTSETKIKYSKPITKIILSTMEQMFPHFLDLPTSENYIVLWHVHVIVLCLMCMSQERLCYDNKLSQNLSTRIDVLFTLLDHHKVAIVLTTPSIRLIRATSNWNFASSHVRQEKNVAGFL